MNILLLSIGGGVGAICRYLLGLAMMKKYPHPPIPIAMLFVNVTGSFGLGLFFGAYFGLIPAHVSDDRWFLGLGVGFFGAFTTFSTFSMEAMHLLRERQNKEAFIYITGSLIGSLIAFAFGYFLGLSIAS
ncbi:fluoride efflux transporter CrcB [Shouchella shacheensis]|uniref:fluoride efflux transporter CrcB n=1 Tax=Shouchella shacheensis TaxID=1649580 RepID=UPI000740275E|nr:fluoride efflux transporter CrcB [Shouchella shacheensis]